MSSRKAILVMCLSVLVFLAGCAHSGANEGSQETVDANLDTSWNEPVGINQLDKSKSYELGIEVENQDDRPHNFTVRINMERPNILDISHPDKEGQMLRFDTLHSGDSNTKTVVIRSSHSFAVMGQDVQLDLLADGEVVPDASITKRIVFHEMN